MSSPTPLLPTSSFDPFGRLISLDLFTPNESIMLLLDRLDWQRWTVSVLSREDHIDLSEFSDWSAIPGLLSRRWHAILHATDLSHGAMAGVTCKSRPERSVWLEKARSLDEPSSVNPTFWCVTTTLEGPGSGPVWSSELERACSTFVQLSEQLLSSCLFSSEGAS